MQRYRVEVQARLPFLADIGVRRDAELFLAGLGVRREAELYLHLTAEPPSLLAWIDARTSPCRIVRARAKAGKRASQCERAPCQQRGDESCRSSWLRAATRAGSSATAWQRTARQSGSSCQEPVGEACDRARVSCQSRNCEPERESGRERQPALSQSRCRGGLLST